jgi:hypothetical protein
MTVETILRLAAAELGYMEQPADSNRTKYGAWYGLDGQPWCVMFVQWIFDRAEAGGLMPAKTASCTALMQAAKRAGVWVSDGYRPGDVVIYDFSGRKRQAQHCGIVERAGSGSVVAIEGNTAVGNDANGGAVMRRTRKETVIMGAVRPDYREEETVRYRYLKDVPEKFRPIVETLMEAGIIQGDGSDPRGNGDVIDLTHEQVRTLVFVYRGGGFDRKLQAAGLKPVI